jgi:hypothetical protein
MGWLYLAVDLDIFSRSEFPCSPAPQMRIIRNFRALDTTFVRR